MEAVSSPPPPPIHPTDVDFSKGLKVSLWAHAALFAFVILKSLVFPDRLVPLPPTLRVDIVGLPDLLKNERVRSGKFSSDEIEKALKKAEEDIRKIKPLPPVKKEAERADPEEMVLKPKPGADAAARQKKLKGALARMKALAKIQSQEDEKPAELIKGNIVSKGTSLSGDAREAAEASYFDSVRDKLQESWALPVWIARQNLSAQVLIFIDSRGRLRGLRFMKLSGNPHFDEAVKRTVMESQPFPIPPAGIAQQVHVDGILVGFPL
jgi:TolA protein